MGNYSLARTEVTVKRQQSSEVSLDHEKDNSVLTIHSAERPPVSPVVCLIAKFMRLLTSKEKNFPAIIIFSILLLLCSPFP